MAGTQMTFTAYGLKETDWMLQDLQRRGEDTQPLMLALAQVGMQQTQHRIRVEQASPEGVKWTPSKAALDRADPGRPTLVDTGDFVGFSFSAEATRDAATWGTNAKQARLFQFGGEIKRKAREGTVRLRTNRDGSLLRQGKAGNLARLARFAKASHKLAREVSFKADEYSIRVVARPFLGLSTGNWNQFQDIIGDHYFAGLGGRA